MRDQRVRTPPGQRLHVPSGFFDLRTETELLRAETTPPQHGHRQKVLFRHGACTVALFAMEPGSVFASHSANGTVTVQVIEGAVEMDTEGRTHHLGCGTMLALAPGVVHDIRAVSRCAFLVHIALESSPADGA